MVEGSLGDQEVRRALAEDGADHDVTTALLGAAGAHPARGRFVAEDRLVVAGLDVAGRVFRTLDPDARLARHAAEGDVVGRGTVLGEVTATAGVLLRGERVALNFLQHLCGVATRTHRLVEAVSGTATRITHTRKTIPGLRALQQYAVVTGGGVANRVTLAQAVYWKDNHWALLDAAGTSLADVLQQHAGHHVWVEVETEAQLEAALGAGVTRLLVDNQTPETVAAWASRAGPAVTIQASGGIGEATVAEFARAGAHLVSIGALTHSVTASPITFELLTDP